jgi:hypothetical protein
VYILWLTISNKDFILEVAADVVETGPDQDARCQLQVIPNSSLARAKHLNHQGIQTLYCIIISYYFSWFVYYHVYVYRLLDVEEETSHDNLTMGDDATARSDNAMGGSGGFGMGRGGRGRGRGAWGREGGMERAQGGMMGRVPPTQAALAGNVTTLKLSEVRPLVSSINLNMTETTTNKRKKIVETTGANGAL